MKEQYAACLDKTPLFRAITKMMTVQNVPAESFKKETNIGGNMVLAASSDFQKNIYIFRVIALKM